MTQPETIPNDWKPVFDAERAQNYDEQVRKRIPGYCVLHASARAVLSTSLPQRARVLAVGTGTGNELITCAQEHTDWTFVGVDPSAEMLSIANEKVLTAGLADRVSLQVGTASELDAQVRFDGATALLVLHLLTTDEEKLQLLQSIATRLKSGGALVLASAAGQPGTPEFDVLLAAWKHHWCKTHELALDDRRVDEHFVERCQRPGWLDEGGHLRLFARAGFIEPVRFWSGLVFNAWVMRKR